MGFSHSLNVLRGRLHEHGKRGDGPSHKLARLLSGSGKEGPRSPHWPTIEKRWKESHPVCAACDSGKGIQVHHKVPFKHDPSLELQDGTGVPPATGKAGDPPNLISLCEGVDEQHHHHLLVGHGDNFQYANLKVAEDAAELKAYPDRGPVIFARAKAGRVKS